MVSPDVSRVVVEEELVGAHAWANRHRLPLDWNAAGLELRVALTQPGTGEEFYLIGAFQDYRAIPPAWTFAESDWRITGRPWTFPAHGATPYGSSLFTKVNNGPVICAPFNRLAYAEASGPHGDWGTPSQWLTVTRHVRATTVGEMLAVICRDLRVSQGRMS